MIDSLNHIGIAVFNIEKVVSDFCRAYGKPVSDIRIVEDRRMKVAVVPFKGCSLEFFEDMNEDSALKKKAFANGAFIHHFAFDSADIERDIAELEESGCERINSEANIGLRGKRILFYTDKTLGFPIELSE